VQDSHNSVVFTQHILDLRELALYSWFSMSNLIDRGDFLPVLAPLANQKWLRDPALVGKPIKAQKADAQPPLDEYFNALFTALGPQHWWPGETPFEIIIGAILTQNTSWRNVELALASLRAASVFTPTAVGQVSLRRLQSLIRSAGYFRQKARALKAFVQFLRSEYRGSLKRMFATPSIALREKLLDVYGIGPETADAILLYAGGHPVFVVDAYTKRIMARHQWIREEAPYQDVGWMFERQFPGNVERFKEFHGLIVMVGKKWCRKSAAECENCPLGRYLEEAR
jgi:endonuclease-3 related protein